MTAVRHVGGGAAAGCFGTRFGEPSVVERDLLAAPATRLLLLAARPAPPADLARAVELAADEAIDWPAFLRLARSHRLTPHVARSLAGCGAVPEAAAARLTAMAARAAARSLAAAAETDRISAALAGAGIPSLTLKGAAVAVWLYGGPDRRMFVDVDVLVPPADVGAAIAVAGAAGYGPPPRLHMVTPAQAPVARKRFFAHDAALFHRDRMVKLELHWRAFNDPTFRALETALQGLVRDPGRADRSAVLAAHVLVHGAAHRYHRLGWLMDAAVLAGRLDAGDWDQVVRLAEADGALNAVLLGPYLAHRLFGAPVPAALEAPLTARVGALRRLAGLTQTRTPDDSGTDQPGALRLHSMLHDRRRDRARYVATKLLRPTAVDMDDRTLRPGWRGSLSRARAQAPRLARFAAGIVMPRRRPAG